MILDSWLALKMIALADFGRRLGLRWPHGVRRYLRRDAQGSPKAWRAPRRDIQFKIRRLTDGHVTPNDWLP